MVEVIGSSPIVITIFQIFKIYIFEIEFIKICIQNKVIITINGSRFNSFFMKGVIFFVMVIKGSVNWNSAIKLELYMFLFNQSIIIRENIKVI